MYTDTESETVKNRHGCQHSFMSDLRMAHSLGLKAQGIKVQAAELYCLCDSCSAARKQYYRRFLGIHMDYPIGNIDLFSRLDEAVPHDELCVVPVYLILLCVDQLEQ